MRTSFVTVALLVVGDAAGGGAGCGTIVGAAADGDDDGGLTAVGAPPEGDPSGTPSASLGTRHTTTARISIAAIATHVAGRLRRVNTGAPRPAVAPPWRDSRAS